MRKIISVVLAFIMIFASVCTLASCKHDDDDKQDPETLTIAYDDRYSFDKDIEKFENADVTSSKTGKNEADDAVLTLKSGSSRDVIATGTGSVDVVFTDGSKITVKVEAAKLNVLLILGQSNAEGADGDEALSVKCKEGQVYSTYASGGRLRVDNAYSFVAKTLTGNTSHTDTELEYKLNALTENGTGKKGFDGAIANAWNTYTGEKVWVINCAHGASFMYSWDPEYKDYKSDKSWDLNNYQELKAVMTAVYITLGDETLAGHYTLSHYGYFWLQGESDSNSDMVNNEAAVTLANEYITGFMKMHEAIKSELAIDEKRIEFAAMILPRTFSRVKINMGENPYTHKTIYKDPGCYDFADIQYSGPRIAQLYMGLSGKSEFSDIYAVSNVGDRFVGNNAYVQDAMYQPYDDETFKAIFGYDMPSKMTDVHHDGPHYTQKGFNELGYDAVRNLLTIKNWYKGDKAPYVEIYDQFEEDRKIPDLVKLYGKQYNNCKDAGEFYNEFSKEYYVIYKSGE